MKGSYWNNMSSTRQDYQWRRSVKRKLEDVDFEPRGASKSSEVEIEMENELIALKEALRSQHQAIEELNSELEEERNASASAANEAMSMILRLQKEKAEVQMEASQFRRFAEGRFAHDQQELLALENLVYSKDQVIQALEYEIQSYKHRMAIVGFGEFDNEKIRSPEKVRLDDREDPFSPSEGCCSRRSSCAEKIDGFDLYNGQMRESVQRHVKEAKIGRIYLEKPNEAVNSWQPSQHWEDTPHQGIMQGQDIGCNAFHPLQSDEYSLPSQGKNHNFNARQVYNNSEVADAQKIAINAIEKSLADDNLTLWECIEKLDERLHQLEKGTQNPHLDNEWMATRKVLQKKLATYSASLKEGSKSHQRVSSDSSGISGSLMGEAGEESSEENSELSNGNMKGNWIPEISNTDANISCSGKKAATSPNVDDLTESKFSASDVSKAQSNAARCRGCKSQKGNLFSSKEGSKSHWRRTTDNYGIWNSSVENNGLLSENVKGKQMLQASNSDSSISQLGKKSTGESLDDVTYSKSSANDVFGVQIDTARCRGCRSLKGNGGGVGEPDLPMQRHEGDRSDRALDLTKRKGEGDVTLVNEEIMPLNYNADTSRAGHGVDNSPTVLPMESRAEPAPVEGEVKQLMLRLQALEGERDSMKQAIQSLKREKAHLALLKEIAQHLSEVRAPEKSQNVIKKRTLQENVSIISIIKWILSFFFRRNTQRCHSKYMYGVSCNNVGLLLLLEKAPKRRLGTFVTRLGM
eukprot:Gb_14972 [translate_table: standard]